MTGPVTPVGGVNVGVNEVVLDKPANALAGLAVHAIVTDPVVVE